MSGDNNGLDYLCLDGRVERLLTITMMVMALLVINTQLFRAKAYPLVSSSSQLAPLIFTNLLFSAV